MERCDVPGTLYCASAVCVAASRAAAANTHTENALAGRLEAGL
mgnify:CR=1 FL=1